MKHTEGPWTAECDSPDGSVVILGPGQSYIAMLDAEDGTLNPADAALIAAAPEMLEALKEAGNTIAYHMVHQTQDPTSEQREQIRKLNDLIDKAGGRA